MERIKISELRKAIETTRGGIADPIQRDYLDRLLKSIRVCPPQFLRITKMNEEVSKIRNNNHQPDTRLDIIENFEEKTTAQF